MQKKTDIIKTILASSKYIEVGVLYSKRRKKIKPVSATVMDEGEWERCLNILNELKNGK